MKKFDSIVGIVGLLSAITMFIAQEQNGTWQKYLFAFSPILVAFLFIILRRSYIKLRAFLKMVNELKRNYDIVTGANVTSDLVVRILNTDGDITYERRFRYEVIKNNVTISQTKKDLIGSESSLAGMPPEAIILDSSRAKISLTPTEQAALSTTRAGLPHFDYRWCYKISPPLTEKGDFVEYEYKSQILGSEKKAFTPEGAVFFFIHEAVLMDIECTLISPPLHKIEIIDYNIEQHDGVVQNIPENETPRLEANGHSLKWKPGHRKGASYICHYRVVKA